MRYCLNLKRRFWKWETHLTKQRRAKMTKKPTKNTSIICMREEKPDKNNNYYCFSCGRTYQVDDDTDKKKLCPRCKGRLGKIIC